MDAYSHPHITKEFQTATVQLTETTVQDIFKGSNMKKKTRNNSNQRK
jgi:hypothetical protein